MRSCEGCAFALGEGALPPRAPPGYLRQKERLRNGLFPRRVWREAHPSSYGASRAGKLGGFVMPRRLVAFLRGDPDAVPGDYLLALVAVFGVMFALLARMLY